MRMAEKVPKYLIEIIFRHLLPFPVELGSGRVVMLVSWLGCMVEESEEDMSRLGYLS